MQLRRTGEREPGAWVVVKSDSTQSPPPRAGEVGPPKAGSEGARGTYRGKSNQSLRTDIRIDSQARQLRADATHPERLLWSKLRNKQLGGFRFRRQHPIGPFIADFYCHEAALIVEVDGHRHEAQRKLRDAERDAWFAERGLTTLRVTSHDVRKRIDTVCATILRYCRESAAGHPHPGPPPHAGEGER
ncbi:MAG: endonuclease domain-containing protein [Phycisphaerales bacterium]